MRVLLGSGSLKGGQGLVAHLRASQCHIEHTDTGQDAFDFARHYAFDVAVIALDLPDIKGDHLIRRMRAARIDVPILALASTSRAEARITALTAGADDVVDLPVDPKELVARLRALVRRSQGHSHSMLSVGPVSANLETHEVTVHGRSVPLTRKEVAILELLMLRRNLPLSKETFLNQLYSDADTEPDPKIIDVFVCKLRKKLADAGATSLIETVWGRGYMVRDAQQNQERRPVPVNVKAAVRTVCEPA